jgi:uncharacterized protein YfcZ (UPF0381/DUF406 family)
MEDSIKLSKPAVVGACALLVQELMLESEKLQGIEMTFSTSGSDGGGETRSLPRFATGGKVKKMGAAIIDPGEVVLTDRQTASWERIASNLTSVEATSQYLRNADKTQPSRSVGENIYKSSQNQQIQADFTFVGGVTSEALPQIKTMMNEAIGQLKKEVPGIVAESRMSGWSRLGGMMTR